MEKFLIIVGANDFGKEIAWIVEDINKQKLTYSILGYVDDELVASKNTFNGYPLIGGIDKLEELNAQATVVYALAVQDNIARKRFVESHPELTNWENIIHPTAAIAPSCVMGVGNVIFPQVSISPDTQLGSFGIYRPQATLGSCSKLGDFVNLMPNVLVGEHAEINDLSSIDVGTMVPSHERWGFLKKLVLIGAGGFGRECVLIIEGINKLIKPTYEILGFLDDAEGYSEETDIMGYPWLGTHEWALQHKDEALYVCAIADVHIKAQLQNYLMAEGVQFESIYAYGSYVSRMAEVGQGCVIYGGVMVSENVKLGNGVLLNTYVTIGHDVTIGDYTTISPNVGVSGNVSIGAEVNIGGHSYIIPGRKIGDGATVGAGSNVVSNVKAGVRVFGNPAKRIDF